MIAWGSQQIVTDGLVLYLDAANKQSYPGTGTTWKDLSGNRKHFTLNSSGISWNSGGYFTLSNGGATYTGTVTTSTTSTLVFWIRTADLTALFWEGNNSAYYVGAYRVGNKEYYSNCGNPQFLINTVDTTNIYDNFPTGVWSMVEFKNVNISSWTIHKFNKYVGYTFDNGAISCIMVYNRNLTSEESAQNYNATKSRFGL